ncbi:MAG: hypothetical protein Q9195_005984 [Heterodermia aff. obscurata]
MAPPTKRALTRAEIGLVQLKNCLVNLPRSLVAVLLNSQTAIQDVIVELQYREGLSASPSNDSESFQQRSVYLGWTGMQSKQKHGSVIGRDGGRGGKEETAVVEMDMTFARTLGLLDSQKVGLLLHPDPPLAHTVNIEPLTPGDWDIIELHASFLEINLLSQIRALPNPSFVHLQATQACQVHPLTLHLSPTSTANIVVSSLTPLQPSTVPFAKLSPNAKVIVAPKTRPRLTNADRTQSRSIASGGRRSAGGRSGASNPRSSGRREQTVHDPLFLRPVDRNACFEYFDSDSDDSPQSLTAWTDRDVMATKSLKGVEWICVSVIRPSGLEGPLDPQQQQQKNKNADSADAGKPAKKVVAKLLEWDDAPDCQHIALSSALCSALGANDILGGLVRVEPAPPPIQRSSVKALYIYPFQLRGQQQSAGFRFGGEKLLKDEAAVAKIKSLFEGGDRKYMSMLDGPLTNGLVLPKSTQPDKSVSWQGGLLRFGLANSKEEPIAPQETQKLAWVMGSEIKNLLELRQEMTDPYEMNEIAHLHIDPIPPKRSNLIGVQSFVDQLFSHLSHSSSVLLTGGLGSGKSSMACLIAHQLRSSDLYYTSYFSCRKLVTDETRTSTIKDNVTRIFMAASWGTRLGGKALIILDDLDKLCPAETELQVGNDNGRSRQISELICSTVRQSCSAGSGVVLLATAESKESLNNVIIGGHAVKEILNLKAPGKDARRQILQALAGKPSIRQRAANGGGDGDGAVWMDGSPPDSPGPFKASDSILVDHSLDFLDLAGQTDGYMPGDLVLLVSRARSECLIRSMDENMDTAEATITLTKEDFQQGLKGFTPASLRNVTLQSSKTSFSSIGGLHETRRILLETLQYPTIYAPIFSQCPLRLRSGLLLYGYPGCGKTLLASAVAGECGLNFISVKGPEILNKYIGASEKSVRDLFERAESARPCVLFFDEFDSIAPKRGHDSTGVTDRVVNQLLTQMDGAEGLSGVYVLAATSRPDLIDPALLRPGRLDKSLICDLPYLDDRLDILHALSKTLKLKPSILASKPNQRESLLEVARRTEGYSGADLQAVVYNAHLEAIHDLLDGKGKKKPPVMVAKEKKNRMLQRSTAPKKEVIQFMFGDDDTAPKQLLGDNAAVLAKLADIKAARRKERHWHDSLQLAKSAADDASEQQQQQEEVVIQWRHIEAALATTRSSISREERLRLEKIYREFVVGRNGEMPRGEGPRDVGGRSSLM